MVSKEGTNERVLDSSFASLLLSIVSDKRFKEKNISLELLKKIIINVKDIEQSLVVTIIEKYRQLIPFVLLNMKNIVIPDRLLSDFFEDKNISKDAVVEIAKLTNDPNVLYSILAFSVYSNDCVEIIWNRRNEFKEKIKLIYQGMAECLNLRREIIVEIMNNYNIENYQDFLGIIPIILNKNFDLKSYQILFSKCERLITQHKFEQREIDLIELGGYNLREFPGAIRCHHVLRCIISSNCINQSAVEEHMKSMGTGYLETYYRLMSFHNQLQLQQRNINNVAK